MQQQEQAMFLRVPENAGKIIKKAIQGERGSETISIVHRQQQSSSSSSSLNTYELDLGGGKPKLRGELLHAPNHVDATKPTHDGAGVFTSQGVTKMLVFGDTSSIADPMPGSSLKLAPSGLTAPTKDIVTRHFKRGWRYISKYAPSEVAETERVLQDLTQLDKPAYEHVVEEIVDAEAFMHSWFYSPKGHQHDAMDNCTIVYENGVLTDIFAMDKGVLVRRSAPTYNSTLPGSQTLLNGAEAEDAATTTGNTTNVNNQSLNSSGTGTDSDKAPTQASKGARGRPKGWKKPQKTSSSSTLKVSSSTATMTTNNEVSVEDLAAIAGAFLDIDEEEMIIDEDGIIDNNGVFGGSRADSLQQGGDGIFVVEGEDIDQDRVDQSQFNPHSSKSDSTGFSLSLSTSAMNDNVATEKPALLSSSSLPPPPPPSSSLSSLVESSDSIQLPVNTQNEIDTNETETAPITIVSPEVVRIETALQLARATLAAEEKKQASTTIAIFKQRWMPQLLAARAEVERLEAELQTAKTAE
jgi:hypothetical protein